MKMIKALVLVAGSAGLLTGATIASADGAALYTQKLCMTCHGPDAKTPIQPSYPKLAGQNAAYCAAQVKDIKSGARANGMTAAMKPLVAAVSDADIQAICDWMATQ